MSCQCSLCCCNIFLLSLVINSCVNHDAATVDTTERIVLTETYSANKVNRVTIDPCLFLVSLHC